MSNENKQILKEIITRLHEGADPDDVKKEFAQVLEKVSAEGVSRAEEELIREGMPREEVQRLCEVHLAVFRESLESQNDSNISMKHPIGILKKEHQILQESAEELVRLTEALRENPENNTESRLMRVRHLVKHFSDSESHYLREENVLFPFLEKHEVKEPPTIMWMEHDQIREIEKNLFARIGETDEQIVSNIDDIARISENLATTISSHFYKENNILFPTALRLFEEHEWTDVREQFDEIGYCCFTPRPPTMEQEREDRKEKDLDVGGVIAFETGSFQTEVLEAMLNTLPVDITFVDKDDRVRYFSNASDRIFVRSKAIIGREVQLCHPQKSMAMVNQILEEFRSGERDAAEFWINMGPKTVYIRYFAVRDPTGEYLGCLEVSQDITEIRKISGEKRLLD